MLLLYPGVRVETHEQIASYLTECVIWYKEAHVTYNNKLKDEMVDKLINSLSYNFGAKLSLYSVYDTLQKYILYRFCEFPPTDGTVANLPAKSWSEQKLNAPDMAEIIHVIRKRAMEGYEINISVGLEEREVRSHLTHSGKISKCISAIRLYNVVRDMIIFLNSELSSQLPPFEYPNQLDFDMQSFLELTDNLESEDNTTLLVVDSVHDLPAEQRKILANMTWDIVLDFDGASSFGGLRSSVTHSNVSDRRLTVSNAKNMSFNKGFTSWLSLSDFVNYSYSPDSRNPKVNGQPFSRNHIRDSRYMIQNLIAQNLVINRTSGLTIVYMRPWDSVGKELLNTALDEYGDSLRFAYIYSFDEDNVRNSIQEACIERGIRQEICCRAYNTTLPRFYSELYKYRDNFTLNVQQTNSIQVPSNEGIRDISTNIFENVSDYFELLHSEVGHISEEDSAKEVKDFYHGSHVPWSAFFYDQVVNIYDDDAFIKNVHKIRTLLGGIPEVLRNKIIYINHSPGIGGTTLLRQFAWEFHLDYPVLVLKKYERSKVKEIIRQLYDLHSRKGILIVADEGQLTSDELDSLEREVISSDRACVLLIATHKINADNVSPQNIIHLKALSNGEKNIARLRAQVKKYSALSTEELNKKDVNFDKFFEQDSSMRCPFIIGLYYLEKQFNGVHDYVTNILKQVEDEKELKIMVAISIADYYGRVGFPSQVVQNYLSIKQNYLKTHPYSNGVFIKDNDGNGNAIYRSKHYLISENILNQVSTRLYGGAHREYLEKLSVDLISVVKLACQQLPYNNYYGNVLERVFIKDKNGGAAEDGIQQSDSGFSRLIETVKLVGTREKILESLAQSFADIADQLDPSRHDGAFLTAAHFYGHLSRIYIKNNIGLRNDQKALENCEIAMKYLDKAEKKDSYIYHMYGMARLRSFQTTLRQIEKSSVTEAVFKNLEDELTNSAEMFDKSADAGNIIYSVLSKMELYIEYLTFVFAVRRISDIAHLNLLSRRQMDLRSEIEEMFARLEGMQLSTIDRSKFFKYETTYKSNIMFNNFGKAIEFYQNRLDQLKGVSSSEEEIVVTTHGLITALIGKYRKTNEIGLSYFEDPSKDVNRILDLIESLIEYTFNKSNYHERQRRISLFSRWLQLAKFSEKSVTSGIDIADRWNQLDPKDARPYYYLYTLHYLRALDGYEDSLKQAEIYRRKCYQTVLARHNSEEDLDIRRLRDIIVQGKGMGRLKDVRHYNKLPAAINNMEPMKLYGSFSHVESKKGFIKLSEPPGLHGVEAKFTLSQGNTLSDKQTSHKIAFYAGFTLEQINAIDHFVRDITTGEKL